MFFTLKGDNVLFSGNGMKDTNGVYGANVTQFCYIIKAQGNYL